MYYNKFEFNSFSQGGEDGVIRQVLTEIGIDNCDKWCCELGAWDGIFYSNTRNLIYYHNYNGVLIEGDSGRFNQLKENTNNLPSSVFPIQTYVNYSENNLDVVLGKTPIPKDFDLLSIDVDGMDYNIWDNLLYTPKLVMIEINSGFGANDLYHSDDKGSSFKSMINLGKTKHYNAIWHGGNVLFIHDKFIDKLSIPSELINSEQLFNKAYL